MVLRNKEYILMLKDTKVCRINRYNGKVKIYEPDLMPFDIYLEEGIWENNITVFDWWCSHRVLSLDREHAQLIIDSCKVKQTIHKADIALEYHCLSLKDFYWVKEKDSKATWKYINLFDNSLSNAVINIALKGENLSITNKTLIVPDLMTDGVLPKAWYRQGKTFYLYKGNVDNSVEKEVMASKILQQLGFPVLNYDKTIYDNINVSVSKCFTSNNVGYVTAGDMIQNYNIPFDSKYDIMNLCDYLVGNKDRHQDNWGFLFDTERKIIGLAPIFDFNHAFEADINTICLPEQLLGRNISMLDIARNVVRKYNINLNCIQEIDNYTKFVNERIKMLY